MRVVGTDIVMRALVGLDAGAAGQLIAWLAEVRQAEWLSVLDIEEAYPSMLRSGPKFAFYLVGKTVRVDTLITFDIPIVMVTDVEWIQSASDLQRRRS